MRFLWLVLVSCCALCAATIPVSIGGPPIHAITLYAGFQTPRINTANFSISLPQFDSSLGTLDSATFSVTLSTEIHYSIFDVGVLPNLTYRDPISLHWNGPYFDITQDTSITGITNGMNDTGFGHHPSRLAGASQRATIVLTGADLLPFIGTGYANISWDRTLQWIPFGGVIASDSDGHTGNVGVLLEFTSDELYATGEYNYTPLSVAPEPRLIGMTLALLIGVLWIAYSHGGIPSSPAS